MLEGTKFAQLSKSNGSLSGKMTLTKSEIEDKGMDERKLLTPPSLNPKPFILVPLTSSIPPFPLSVSYNLSLSPSITNLGVSYDPDLSFDTHINHICKISLIHQSKIAMSPGLLLRSSAMPFLLQVGLL